MNSNQSETDLRKAVFVFLQFVSDIGLLGPTKMPLLTISLYWLSHLRFTHALLAYLSYLTCLSMNAVITALNSSKNYSTVIDSNGIDPTVPTSVDLGSNLCRGLLSQ